MIPADIGSSHAFIGFYVDDGHVTGVQHVTADGITRWGRAEVQSTIVFRSIGVVGQEYDLGTSGRNLCSCVLASALFGILGCIESWFEFRYLIGKVIEVCGRDG